MFLHVLKDMLMLVKIPVRVFHKVERLVGATNSCFNAPSFSPCLRVSVVDCFSKLVTLQQPSP